MPVNSLGFKLNKVYPYVIHFHTPKRNGKHYDLRIENSRGTLTDFASVKLNKAINEKQKVILFRQPDHPKWFLDFEGELPGQGTFTIWDKGVVKVVKKTDYTITLEFSGYRVNGYFVIMTYKDNYMFFKVRKPRS